MDNSRDGRELSMRSTKSFQILKFARGDSALSRYGNREGVRGLINDPSCGTISYRNYLTMITLQQSAKHPRRVIAVYIVVK